MTFNPDGPHDLHKEYAEETTHGISAEDLRGLTIVGMVDDPDAYDADACELEYHRLLKENEPYRQLGLQKLEYLKTREHELRLDLY